MNHALTRRRSAILTLLLSCSLFVSPRIGACAEASKTPDDPAAWLAQARDEAPAALRPMAAPENPEPRAGSRAMQLTEAAQEIALAKGAVADPPAPVPAQGPAHLQEGKRIGYAMAVAPVQAGAGKVDRALATVRDNVPALQTVYLAQTYARIATAAARGA